METRLKELLEKLRKLQDEHKGKPMPEDVAAEFEKMATEAEGIQKDLDRRARAKRLEDQAKLIPAADGQVPPDSQPDGKDAKPAHKVVGYLKLGDYVTASKGLKSFIEAGMPRQQVQLATCKSLFEPVVALSAAALEELKQSVPTIGDGVIEPTRLADMVRVTEHDRLTLRDVLDVSQTSSNAVEYMRLVSYTRGASTVAHGGTKPHATLAMDAVTEAVRTIAVWMPVQNQQLQDLPALAGIINGELLYDVAKHVEEQVMYGSGVGQEFSGILVDAAVPQCRSEMGDTLIDIARRGITDVRRAGYEPNAITVDPLDWETIILEKGSDNRYVWVVVTEGNVQRLWGVPVIETVAMEDYAGVSTEARNMIVGDYRRGATLWDRMQAAISVGWINDQFITNQRTLLAELRAAFGIKRPGAFRKYETQAASAS